MLGNDRSEPPVRELAQPIRLPACSTCGGHGQLADRMAPEGEWVAHNRDPSADLVQATEVDVDRRIGNCDQVHREQRCVRLENTQRRDAPATIRGPRQVSGDEQRPSLHHWRFTRLTPSQLSDVQARNIRAGSAARHVTARSPVAVYLAAERVSCGRLTRRSAPCAERRSTLDALEGSVRGLVLWPQSMFAPARP